MHRISDYEQTEFYPKSHVFAYGLIKYEKDGKTHIVSVCVMKLNSTKFITNEEITVDGSYECGLFYKGDTQLLSNLYETLEKEIVLVAFAIETKPTIFKTDSYITSIDTISSICTMQFLKTVMERANVLIDK